MIKAGPAYDQRNEFEHRDDVARELANKYDKRQDIVIPYGKKLGFNGTGGEQVVLSYDDAFKVTIDGTTVVELATDSALTALTATVGTNTANIATNASTISTVDGKLTASYALTVDVNGRIASMKLLSNGTTSSVKFTASTFQVYNGTTDEAPFEVVGGVVKIKTANIGDLNATNITAGTLNVDRINAGTIVTDKLAVNAVTQGSVQENDADLSFGTTTWTTAAEVTVTTPDANSLVFLPFSVFFYGDVDGSLAEGRILRGATEIYQTYLAGNPAAFDYEFTDEGYILYQPTFNGQVSGFDTDAPGAAGTYTYYFQIRTNGSSATWVANRRRLLALLFKR